MSLVVVDVQEIKLYEFMKYLCCERKSEVRVKTLHLFTSSLVYAKSHVLVLQYIFLHSNYAII